MSALHALGLFVVVFGAILIICGQVWLIAEAFAESIALGVVCLIFPVAQLLFAAFYPRRAAWPFAMVFLGVFSMMAYALGVSAFVS